MLCGGFENEGTSLDPRGVTVDSPLPAAPDWDVLGGFAEGLGRFVPGLPGAGVSTTFRGWPGFTPDGRFLVGPVSAIRGLVSRPAATRTVCPARPAGPCTWWRAWARTRRRTSGR